MAEAIKTRITDAEWEIMRVVWANGSTTSREIIEVLEDKMDWKAATIKTLIGRLVDKEALQTHKEGRKFIYSALISERDSMNDYTEEVLSRVCNKQAGKVIGNMLAGASLSQTDIQNLMEILEEKKETAPEEVACQCAPGQCDCHLHYH